MKAKELIRILQGVNPEAHVLFKIRERTSDEVIEKQVCLGEIREVEQGNSAWPAGYPNQFLTHNELETWRIRWGMEGSWSPAVRIVTYEEVND